MSSDWSKVSKQLLAIPWAAFPLDDDNDDNPSNVLVKVLGPASDLEVVLFCSDLRGCWLEVLTRRKLVRRVRQALQDAGAEQSQTLSSGHGEDEELLLRKTVDEVLAALRGIVTAELTLEKSSYTASLLITLPAFTFKFDLDPLEASESAEAIETHIITPLFGASSTLVGLLASGVDKHHLPRKLEDDLTHSGATERSSSGKSCQTFFRAGGGNVLGRWAQASRGLKNDLLPITLAGSSTRPTPRPARRQSPPSPPVSSKRRPSPSPPVDATTQEHASRSPQKLTRDEVLAEKKRGKGAPPANDHDESTAEDYLQASRTASSAYSIKRSDALMSPNVIKELSPEPTPVEIDVASQTEAADEEDEEEAEQRRQEAKKEKKRLAKEKEEAEELEQRRLTLQRAKARSEALAKSAQGAPVKKKKKL